MAGLIWLGIDRTRQIARSNAALREATPSWNSAWRNARWN